VRKIIASEFITLDGVFEEPGRGDWHFQYFSDELGRYKLDEVTEAEAQLLGRVTYEGFAAAWPHVEDEQGFADKMNTMPKYVVSSTLEDPTWENTTVLRGDPLEAVREVKSGDGGPLLIGGSGQLVRTLTAGGLIDELRLIVHPIVVGEGARLFDGTDRVPLTLTEAKPLDSGIVILVYGPSAAEGAPGSSTGSQS
jgi:dihydrofolate reductase